MCLTPVTIPVRGTLSHLYPTKFMTVPCGKCVECVKKYQNDWSVRLSVESDYHNCGVFFTLTYNEDTVPLTVNKLTGECFKSVCKYHVQNWFKRFRERYYKHYGKRFSGKYFITSEYGPRTLRPHYHGVILGIDLYSFKLFALTDWEYTYGFYNARSIMTHDKSKRFSAYNYASKYCAKGEFENPLVIKKYVEPTFRLISKGIGLNYVKEKKDYYLAKHYLRDNYFTNVDDYLKFIIDLRFVELLNGKGKVLRFSLPRYFKDKIYENSYLRNKITMALHQMHDDLYNKELETLQSTWHVSLEEAAHLQAMQEICLLRRRTEQTRLRFCQYLEQSKL